MDAIENKYKTFNLLKVVINNYEKTENKTRNYIYKTLNQYLIALLITFLFTACLTAYFYDDSLINVLNWVVISYLFLMLILKKKPYILGIKAKGHLFFVYFVLMGYIGFLSYYTNDLFGMEHYFFSILSSLAFSFDFKRDKNYIFAVFALALFFDFGFDFLPQSTFVSTNSLGDTVIKVSHTLFTMGYIFLTIFVVYNKERYIHKILNEKSKMKDDLNELEKRYQSLMKSQLVRSNVNPEDIDQLFNLAKSKSPTYFEKFCDSFPTFKEQLLGVNPALSFNELYVCSLMKLNFDTKNIAIITDLSVRAVESLKYRLKKKLYIDTQMTIQEHILRL